jgi:hypothetical protein
MLPPTPSISASAGPTSPNLRNPPDASAMIISRSGEMAPSPRSMMRSIAASTSRTLARREIDISPTVAQRVGDRHAVDDFRPCAQAIAAIATKAAAAKPMTRRPAVENEPKVITLP